jgi:hypothetical protein
MSSILLISPERSLPLQAVLWIGYATSLGIIEEDAEPRHYKRFGFSIHRALTQNELMTISPELKRANRATQISGYQPQLSPPTLKP